MRINLVSGDSAATEIRRIPYGACPLCSGEEAVDIKEVDCSRHPSFKPGLPATIRWIGCKTCGHIFTEGYLDEAALERLFSAAHSSQLLGANTERDRPISGRIVERVSHLRGVLGGSWLDVGVGAGSLMTTAEEFGYETLGLDLRAETVQKLEELGYNARQHGVEGLEGEELFDVISMADVLEHMPFPAVVLQDVHRLLRPQGVVFLSMPNVDSFVWRHLEQAEQNPYWVEIEHFHNFSREHLYWLLRKCGFEPIDYSVSERYRAGMEVIAMRSADLQ